ncbi:MAG TPA: hypothetical protein VFZ31_12770 [Vicinamibacterales bacterium]
MPAVTASAQGTGNQNRNRLEVPVTGTAAGVGAVTGNYSISEFKIADGKLVAVGTVTATVRDAAGNIVRNFVAPVAIPVNNGGSAVAKKAAALEAIGGSCDTDATEAGAAQLGSCDILSLVLGPLHLDLLGLQIDLNQVVLDITAQTGSGNLLGNLLCAITGLLDAGSLGQQVVNLLNQLIGILGSL